MSASDTPTDFSDSDQRWLDALMAPYRPGQEQATPLDAPAQEATLLREALRQQRAWIERSPVFQSLSDPALTERRLQALLADLRRRGLLQAEASPPSREPRWWHWGAPAGLIAAVFFGFAVLPSLLSPPPPGMFGEPPSWRGAQEAIVRRVPEPLAEAQAVQQRLKAAGVWSAIYQQGQDYVLDVDVDAAQLEDVAPALAAEGLPPQPGMVRLRFVKQRP